MIGTTNLGDITQRYESIGVVKWRKSQYLKGKKEAVIECAGMVPMCAYFKPKNI